MIIGDNIKKIRKSRNLTQKQLGEMIDKKEITIRRYEKGDIIPPITVINDIAEALMVSTSDLLPSLTQEDIEQFDKQLPRIQKDLNLADAIDLILRERGHKISDFSEDEYKKIEKSIIEYLDTIAYMKK